MGIGEWLILAVALVGIPMGVLSWVAGQRGQSRRFALWGVLSYVGLLVGLLVMLAVPTRHTASRF